MIDIFIARAFHTVAVVLSLGYVAFAATILLPGIRASEAPERQLAALMAQAAPYVAKMRVSIAVLGLSGLYLTVRMDAWWRFADPRSWWMHAMVGAWLLLALSFYLLEPSLRPRIERAILDGKPGAWFSRIEFFHQVLLGTSLLTVLAATGGSHGFIG